MKKFVTLLLLIATPSLGNDWSFIEASPSSRVVTLSWAFVGPSPVLPEKEETPEPRYTRLVYIGASWCQPCNQVKQFTIPPLIKSGWKIQNDNLGHIQILDWDKDNVSRYRVSMLPTWILLEDEKEVSRAIGYLSPQGVSRMFTNQTGE